ncbi:TPA: NAD(P)-dependent oxidoreductase [Candidatus Poribacteria bacterium]|nr:NAD(P)-dependent oxidoreductase [Candidatus Poribacteria bacterium]HIB88783.1 NAD(P)-dependent oxidoreductase [Candidatus Poribacteria bacterium]HIC00544.1 NAD(P)-dependent oxidoreductase [Candidatus Poribacteria bacterium]HIN31463.1 NAD(P)-dependent oxidoreductase [Candidatus Poribacteria bacterium]HIO47856.1 NAD(P)-dependent oxidoreductase [Candidatus Poribacteria bacterium]
MSLETVAILSPGDMGHMVGRVLAEHGLRVITCLTGRSQRTRVLAEDAGILDVSTLQTLVSEADIILSILVPAQATSIAEMVSEAIIETQAKVLYVDCNAISPKTTRRISETITNAGGNYLDGSIIGPPPRSKGLTRFYVSGPEVDLFSKLNQFGLDICPLGDKIGKASAIKMCYAALTKGLSALCIELLTASKLLEVSEPLASEFQLSQPSLYERMERTIPGLPSKSRRWVGEMKEISATFAEVGLTPKILDGAADMFQFVGDTRLANLHPEDQNSFSVMKEVIAILSEHLET